MSPYLNVLPFFKPSLPGFQGGVPRMYIQAGVIRPLHFFQEGIQDMVCNGIRWHPCAVFQIGHWPLAIGHWKCPILSEISGPNDLLILQNAAMLTFKFSRAEHSRPDVAKYIFDIYYLLTMLFVYWFLWPLRLVWLLVCCLYKEVYL